MFCTVSILHIIPKGLLLLCSVGCLVLRIDIHSHVPLSKWYQTSGKYGWYMRKYTAFPSLESLQHSIWTSSVVLTSQRRTCLPFIESSSWWKLASHHPPDGTCHCTLWYWDEMWVYASLTSKGSNIEMASLLQWHTWHSSIRPELCRVAGFHCILGFQATGMWISVIGRCAWATPV